MCHHFIKATGDKGSIINLVSLGAFLGFRALVINFLFCLLPCLGFWLTLW